MDQTVPAVSSNGKEVFRDDTDIMIKVLLSGPTSAEVQSTWIADCVLKMSNEGIKFINPTKGAQKDWKKLVNAISQATLVPTTRSTYMGGAIPGKPYEQLTFLGGLPMYAAEIKKALDTLAWFEVVRDQCKYVGLDFTSSDMRRSLSVQVSDWILKGSHHAFHAIAMVNFL